MTERRARRPQSRPVLRCAAPAICIMAAIVAGQHLNMWTPAVAEEASSDAALEKEAFDAAKDLGTVQAWEAFLKSFSSGFRADLAKAYIKKLNEGGPPDASGAAVGEVLAPSASTAALSEAEELPCRDAGKLRSEESKTAAKLVFSNQSKSDRRITWIDFRGKEQKSIVLKPGDENIQQTFLTHPWLIRDERGKCLLVIRAVGEASMARL